MDRGDESHLPPVLAAIPHVFPKSEKLLMRMGAVLSAAVVGPRDPNVSECEVTF